MEQCFQTTPRKDSERIFPINVSLLRKTLPRLSSLASLHLTWTEDPRKDMSDAFGRTFKEITSVSLAYDEIVEVQQCVLHTLTSSNVRLKSLILEPFLFSELAMPSTLDPQALVAFSSITDLSISLLRTQGPLEQDILEYFISLLPNLTNLALRAISPNQTLRDVRFLPEIHLQHLEKIDLRCMQFRLDGFKVFLRKHSTTIRQISLVSLDGVSSSRGPLKIDWDAIFRTIRAEFDNLESAYINGMFRQERANGQTLGGQVFFHDKNTIEEGCFDERYYMEGEIMERYLVCGGKYPLPQWTGTWMK